MKKPLFVLTIVLCILFPIRVQAEETISDQSLELTAESAFLIEATTGKVIYEKNADVKKAPASVTKIMTLLLIFEDLNNGKISLQDQVTVTSHAASMGGSQVFLEEGESQSVDTLIKCIAVSSGNDAAVAMAEHLSGSEEAFVERMNQKAEKLEMKNTHFVNCCGLDAEGHMTTAKDIAIMSRELTMKYPDIFRYSSIWMDEFIHKTAKGESVFGLSNTNKLLKTYHGCNGLKTGSTSKAKFCISATATRKDISLIAVVMGCPDSKSRSKDVSQMFDYGFANVTLYEDANPLGDWKKVDITGGEKESVKIRSIDSFTYTLLKNEAEKEISKKVRILEKIKAPVNKDEIIGEIDYRIDGNVIGTVPIYAAEDVKEKTYLFSLKTIWDYLRLDT